jgi:hypothetical protein
MLIQPLNHGYFPDIPDSQYFTKEFQKAESGLSPFLP